MWAGWGEGGQERIGRRNYKRAWGDLNIFTRLHWWFQGGVHTSELIKWYTLNVFHLLYVNYTSIQLSQKRPVNYILVCFIHSSLISLWIWLVVMIINRDADPQVSDSKGCALIGSHTSCYQQRLGFLNSCLWLLKQFYFYSFFSSFIVQMKF